MGRACLNKLFFNYSAPMTGSDNGNARTPSQGHGRILQLRHLANPEDSDSRNGKHSLNFFR